MVDAGAFGEDHLATQIPGIEYTDQPHEAKNGGSNPITWTGQEPEEKGDEVEDRRTHVENGVIEANPALGAIGIAPVRKAGHNRPQRSKEANDYRDKGSIRCPGVVSGGDQPDNIKES